VKSLKVDLEIFDHLGMNPGCNLEQCSIALRRNFSGPYVKERCHTLIARGEIRAEVSAAGRYRLYLSNENKPMEA